MIDMVQDSNLGTQPSLETLIIDDENELKGLLVSEETMELDDEFIFFFSEIATLDVRAEIVYPPHSTTLARSKQSYTKHKNSTKKKIYERLI